MALFHNEKTGASARYKLFFNGTFDFLIDTPSWPPGWTAITTVPIPRCCTLLAAVKE